MMRGIALAMKSKDFEKVIQLYEEREVDDEEDDEKKRYEVHVCAGKSYFEQKRYAKSRECYVKAVGIDKEREQAHKGIVEVGFDGDGEGDEVFLKEHAVPSVTFLLDKASETGDVEKKEQYLVKLCEGYSRCGEHLEAAKAYRDLGDLMLKEKNALDGASSAIIKAAKCAILFAEEKAKVSANESVADAKSKTIVSRKDEIQIAKQASIACFASIASEMIPFLDGYFRTTEAKKDVKDELGGSDAKDIETFAVKLARARLDCSARNVEENGKKDADALKFAEATFHHFIRKYSESSIVDTTTILALALDIVAFSGAYLGDEEEGWDVDSSSSKESLFESAMKEHVKDPVDEENPLWVLFTAWNANKNLGRGSFHRSCLGNDLECHHEGTRVELGSRDAKMDKEVLKLFETMERSMEADGESDEVLSSTSYSTLQLAMVSMLQAESRAYLGDALGALDIARGDAVCSVSGLAKTQQRAQLIIAESHAKLGRPFDYDALVKASPARGARIRAYYIATTSVAADAKAQKLKWLRVAYKAAPRSLRCAFEFAWASGDIDACDHVISSWLDEHVGEEVPADVTARWASRRASLAASANQLDVLCLRDDRSIFTLAAKAAKVSSGANPFRALAFSALSLCVNASGDTTRASKLREKALALDPSDEISGPLETSSSSSERCREVCENAIKWNPNCTWASEKLASDKDPHVALSALKILIRTKRESVAMWTNMGDCYRRLDRKSAAVDAFEGAVTLHLETRDKNEGDVETNASDALYAATVAGNVSLQLGNLERAESSYKIAHDIFLTTSPPSGSNEVPILVGLARCFALDASRSAMRGATARCEQSAKESIAYGEKALEVINNDATVSATSSNEKKYAILERVVRTLLGKAYLLMNNFDSAASEFRKCVDLFPELASMRENLARALLLSASSSRDSDDAISKAKSACIDYANAEDSDFSAAWRALAKIPRGKNEDDTSYYGRVETCLSRAASLGISQNKATVWASLAQLYKTNADVRRQGNSDIADDDTIDVLERAASTCLDKSRTLNPHEGIAWIHTGEKILSEGIFKHQQETHENDGDDEEKTSTSGAFFYENAAEAFDVATKCAFEDAEHARIADAKFAATAAVAVLSDNLYNAHRYENIATAVRAARARANDPVAHWSLAMMCERRGLFDMAKEAFENASELVLNGDISTLDFTFGNGESEDCRNALSVACREGLERLEKRKALTSAQNDLSASTGSGGDATYSSLKRHLQNALLEDPSNVYARELLAQLLLSQEADDDDALLALNVVSEPKAPFHTNSGGKGDFREQSDVARSVAWSCIANSPAYVYPIKSDDTESDKTKSEILFRRANRMAAIATVLNPGDARNQEVLQTCLNRLQLLPRVSGGPVSSFFNLDDEKMLRELAKMDESRAENNIETVASARLALAAKLAQSAEKEKRKEAKKHATRVLQTNTITNSTELEEEKQEEKTIKISERLVRASESFLAGSE